MATKAKKATSKPDNAVQAAEPKAETKKMTKESAQAIVNQYSGINGVDVPELTAAKKFLKENS